MYLKKLLEKPWVEVTENLVDLNHTVLAVCGYFCKLWFCYQGKIILLRRILLSQRNKDNIDKDNL